MFALVRRTGAIAGLLLFADAAGAANGVTAITTAGSGTLTMCEDWIIYHSCNDYHHVALPKQIKLGDHVRLTFGSNLKNYDFPVVRITRDGDTCTVLSEDAGNTQQMDRIEIPSCAEASGTP